MATFNTELQRKGPGLLLRDILKGDDPQINAVIDTITSVKPDILTLQGFDYDLEGRTLMAFAEALAAKGVSYTHFYAAPPNAGRMTEQDRNQNGTFGEARDAQGYGRFFGQGAMALLSRYPVDPLEALDFTSRTWRSIPDNLYPMTDTGPWGGRDVADTQRLSSHGHWVVPVDHPTWGRMHVLTFHASPPVFDGPEDFNGRRNHDEVAFWRLFMDGVLGTAPQEQFILMGDANADPDKGDSRPEAIRALLSDPRLQDPLPGQPTVTWAQTGPMRVDYVLPSSDWQVTDAGLTPPNPDASRHRLVWVDVTR